MTSAHINRILALAFTGHLGACIVCGLALHYFVADWIVSISAILSATAYWWSMALLSILGVARGISIYLGTNRVASQIDASFSNLRKHGRK